MDKSEYIIQKGDNFYSLAQRFGGTCEDWMLANPNVNPVMLQIGQKVMLPELKAELKGKSQYAEISVEHGKEFAGDHLDEIEMELAGVQFRVKRIGETKIPHEIHVIMPRAEIRKIQPAGENGPCEVQIMLSNVNIVHSPRLQGEGGDRAEKGKTSPPVQEVPSGQQGASGIFAPAQSPAQLPQFGSNIPGGSGRPNQSP